MSYTAEEETLVCRGSERWLPRQKPSNGLQDGPIAPSYYRSFSANHTSALSGIPIFRVGHLVIPIDNNAATVDAQPLHSRVPHIASLVRRRMTPHGGSLPVL